MNKVLFYIKKGLILIKVLIIVFFKVVKLGIEWVKSDKTRTKYALGTIGLILIIFISTTTFRSCKEAAKENEEEIFPLAQKKNLNIKPFGDYQRAFNDKNDVHLRAAKKNGIEVVKSRAHAETLKHKLEKIESNKLYKVENLTHSIPYLVPKAKSMLDEIGQSFQDSLKSKGVGSYKIVVTSVLRSNEDVHKLRKVNVNATSNSAHRHGTTIDIGYYRFERTDNFYPYEIPKEQLKIILAEVLRDLKKQGKVYVKYEVKQGCFHITVR